MKLDIGGTAKTQCHLKENRVTLAIHQCDSESVSLRLSTMSEYHRKKVNLFLRTYNLYKW